MLTCIPLRTIIDTLLVKDELAPLIEPEKDEPSALRFDALLFAIELAYLAKKNYGRGKKDLLKKVEAISTVATIPEVKEQGELIDKMLHTDYVERADVNEFEYIREKLRGLMKYIPRRGLIYETDFNDEILSVEWKESELENDDLKNYKSKAEFYVRQHQDMTVIDKLKGNIPLASEDIMILENILWNELGTKQEYECCEEGICRIPR